MSIRFRPLLQVEIVHGYYDGLCRDLDFVLPPGDPALAAGKLLPRVRDGRLVILFEADAGGLPLRSIAGSTLLVGLRLNNPAFANFSAPPVAAGALALYANGALPTAFDAALPFAFVAGQQRISPAAAGRPLTLRWQQGALTLAERVLAAGEEVAFFDTRYWPAGRLSLSETAGGPPLLSHWLQSPALVGEGLWGVLAIAVDGGFYANPPTLALSLAARSEVLKYYIVASNFSANEFGQIELADAGATEQSRPVLAFDKVLPADFAPEDIPPAALGDAAKRIALFRSQAPVARRAGGYRKLQLKRNNDILVQHLPQAGSDRAQAHFIVHLAKS